MRKVSASLLCACAAALNAPAVHAQDSALSDLTLEQLMEVKVDSVYSASRYEQLVTQAPSSISIITADEIRRFGYRSFEDLLRSVRGLYVPDDRNYANLGVRGFHRPGDYTTRVLVMFDGHRLNDNVYDSGAIGRDGAMDVELIERAEVIRGPSSSVYGSSAFLAVVNIITKKGGDIGGAEVSYDAGSLKTQRARATYGDVLANGLELHASATHYESSGMETVYYKEFDQRVSDDPRARDNGIARDLDDERATKFFTNLKYGHITASAYYSDRYKQVPTGSFGGLFNDPASYSGDKRAYLDVAYDGSFANGLQYRARGFYDRQEYEGGIPYDYALPGDPEERVVYRDASFGEWVGAEATISGTAFSRFTFVAGSEYRCSLHELQQQFDDVQPRFYYLDDDTSGDVLGLFTQVETRVSDSLSLTGGLRYDGYSDGVGRPVSPRLAAIFSPTSRSAFKALYGEAFRAPNPFERYYYHEEQPSHPKLEPETIKTYELVYEQYLGAPYRLSLSAFNYEVRNLISQTTSDEGNIYFDNLDAVQAYGAEVELEGKFENGLLARASYTWQRAKDDITGDPLSSSPRSLAKLNVSVPVLGSRTYGNLELQYHSKSLTLADTYSPSFVLTIVSFTTDKLWSRVELSASIYNLFDQDHVYPASEEHLQETLSVTGRTYQGKLVVRF